ncbi:MAG: pyrroline-5-carboxylate reductase [Clostridiaceae bacterium]|nr:pyrroline-5-carboxylate reductase [Clostridiaceae bacterium]
MNIGFIGSGNMAEAMMSGILNSDNLPSVRIMGSDYFEKTLKTVKEKYKIETTVDNKEVARFSDIIVLSVKPDKYGTVIEEIKDHIKTNAVVVTIAAGISIDFVERAFGKAIKLVRVMPNTPALVGEGMSALSFNSYINLEEKLEVIKIFESFGKAETLEESLMDAVPAISGSSPAYVFMFIEALADGAVLSGIPRDKAYKMAAQSVLGAAKMVLESGKHPGELKDNVCSPGGTTIEAVYTLENNNFRGTIMAAMESCTAKAKKMSQK